MKVSDRCFLSNSDWDPCYLASIFQEDFREFSDLWISTVKDEELDGELDRYEQYCPIVEDISLDDNVLCSAVEKIEAS